MQINDVELHQIINNLFSNAHYQLLHSDISEKRITINSEQVNGYCQITFEDNGGGFPLEVINHKFKAFCTTKPVGEGTGLGLWTIKKIVDEINGDISIRNSEVGAKIIIRIPLLKNSTV